MRGRPQAANRASTAAFLLKLKKLELASCKTLAFKKSHALARQCVAQL